MKTTSTLLLGLLLPIMLPFILTNASATTNQKILLFYPWFAEIDSINNINCPNCTWGTQVTNVVIGAMHNALPPTDVLVNADEVASDEPPSVITDFRDRLPQCHTVFLNTHGDLYNFGGEDFASTDGRNLRWRHYKYDLGVDTLNYQPFDLPPGPGIMVTANGTYDEMRPNLTSDVILGLFYCNSFSHLSYWGTVLFETWSGPTVFCYPGDVGPNTVCANISEIALTMGCHDFPYELNYTSIAAQHCPSLVHLGNNWNTLNCCADCVNTAVRFRGAAAFDGAFHWTVSDEDANSEYTVRQYAYEGAPPETLAVVPGRGTDGARELRGYVLSVSPEEAYGDIVEVDDAGRSTISDPILWGSKPTGWLDLPEPELVQSLDDWIPEVPDPGGPLFELVDSTFVPFRTDDSLRLEPPHDQLCADIVIYSSKDDAAWFAPVEQQAHNWQTGEGFYYKARMIRGSSNPLDARAAYAQVRQANLDYNEDNGGDRTYPEYPILIISGNYLTVSPFYSADDQYETCGVNNCPSWSLITDLDTDGVPDGAVSVIPADSTFQISRACDAADDWNHGYFVDPGRSLLMLVGDRYNNEMAPWLSEEFHELENVYRYTGGGHGIRGMLRESDFSPYDYSGMMSEGVASINAGVRDVWLQGLSTDPDGLTRFLNSNWVSALTRQQRIVVFAPSCETGCPWGLSPPQACSRLLFNNSAHTVAAAFVGNLTGGYVSHHSEFREVLLNEICNARHGEPYAETVHRAVVTMANQFPKYGQGIITFGALVLCPGDFYGVDPAAVPSAGQSGAGDDIRLWATPHERSTALHFSVPEVSDVDLGIFAVDGRKVATVVAGQHRAGGYVYSWFPQSSASGIYFARLIVRTAKQERTRTYKFLYVK